MERIIMIHLLKCTLISLSVKLNHQNKVKLLIENSTFKNSKLVYLESCQIPEDMGIVVMSPLFPSDFWLARVNFQTKMHLKRHNIAD